MLWGASSGLSDSPGRGTEQTMECKDAWLSYLKVLEDTGEDWGTKESGTARWVPSYHKKVELEEDGNEVGRGLGAWGLILVVRQG